VNNGHSFRSLIKSFKFKKVNTPTVLIIHTIKGKGIKKFESNPIWHARIPNEIEIKEAKRSLGI